MGQLYAVPEDVKRAGAMAVGRDEDGNVLVLLKDAHGMVMMICAVDPGTAYDLARELMDEADQLEVGDGAEVD